MKNTVGFFLVCALTLSCGPSKRGLFRDKKSPHEQYADKIKNAGLDVTLLGKRWFEAADSAMSKPRQITLPYNLADSFIASKPAASGFLVDGKRGAILNILFTTDSINNSGFFTELWQPSQDQNKPKLLSISDSALTIKHEIETDGPLLIRVQPELLLSIKYTMQVTLEPSIGFPVSSGGKPRIISFWKDPRDRGARSHEGIDISASFRTPAIAAADGHIQSVTTNKLGGNVIFLRVSKNKYTLYYAHLDTQLVVSGQQVRAGDTIGLIGNTGNAKGTIPHLHFGIYAIGGAVDPLPFVSPTGIVRK